MLEYIKHDRPVAPNDEKSFGKLATHDLLVDCLLLYGYGVITDSNGTRAKIDNKFCQDVCVATNKLVQERLDNPLSKNDPHLAGRTLQDAMLIPVIENHDSNKVKDKSGYIMGELKYSYIPNMSNEVGEPIAQVTAKLHIIKPEIKRDIVAGLLNKTSLGIRANKTIRETSFVVNEAMPLCGLILSEPNSFIDKLKFWQDKDMVVTSEKTGLIGIDTPTTVTATTIPQPVTATTTPLPNTDMKFAEQILELQEEHDLLQSKIIPNHFILSKMIKSGKLYPHLYSDLLLSETKLLHTMANAIPIHDLGIVVGTSREPQRIPAMEIVDSQLQLSEKIAKEANKYKEKYNIKQGDDTKVTLYDNMIVHQPKSDETVRNNYKQILEIAETSPEAAMNYIKFELGEEVENPKYKDNLILEYTTRLNEVKTQIIELKEHIQL